MAENKTQPTAESVDDFINQCDSPQKREDSFVLKKMMEEITGEKAVMWGPSIIGFGTYHYKYDSGREGDFLTVGFSPRKSTISLYIIGCMHQDFDFPIEKLGKVKTGASCIYINKLSSVNQDALRELIAKGYQYMKEKYPSKI